MDTGIVVAIVGGVLGLAGAFFGIVPNLGRLRRLERIVAILEKTEDLEGRRRVLAMRDRLLTALEPNAASAMRRALIGFVIVLAGYGAVAIAIFFGGGFSRDREPWSIPTIIAGAVVFLVGFWMYTHGFLVRVRLRRVERAAAAAEIAAAEAAAISAESAARPWWKRLPRLARIAFGLGTSGPRRGP